MFTAVVWGLAVALGALLAVFTANAALTRSLPGIGAPAAASAEPVIAYDLDLIGRLRPTDRRPWRAKPDALRWPHPGDGWPTTAYLARLVSGGPAWPRPGGAPGSGISSPALDQRAPEGPPQRGHRGESAPGGAPAAVAWAAAEAGRANGDDVEPFTRPSHAAHRSGSAVLLRLDGGGGREPFARARVVRERARIGGPPEPRPTDAGRDGAAAE